MKKILQITSLSLLVSIAFACSKSNDDSDKNKKLGYLALYLRSRTTGVTVVGTKKQVTQASTAKTAATTASKGAAKAASVKTKSVSFFDSFQGKAVAAIIRRTIDNGFSKKFEKYLSKHHTFATGLTCSGDGCDGDGNATITGSETCGKGGTYTMNSLAFTAAADGTMTLTGGTVSFTNCKNEVVDVLNYPAKSIVTIDSGTLTPRGSVKYTIPDDYTTTSVEDVTVNGTITVGGASITLTDLKNVTNLTEAYSSSDTDFYYIGQGGTKLTTAQILTNYTDEDGNTYQDIDYTKVYGLANKVTANGSLTTSGTISGDAVSFTGTFTNKTATASFVCTKNWNDMTDADWASDTVCTYTVQ